MQRQTGSLTKIKLKKTGIFLTEDRKQEDQEDKRRSQEEIKDEEGRSSIPQRSSPNQERKKKEATSSSITRPKSTKNLVNLFENISSAEEIQILGGKSSGPIRQDASSQQPHDWKTQIIRSGITNFKAGKQLKIED